MTMVQSLPVLETGWGPTISAEANLRQQVKHSGRSQNPSTERRASFWNGWTSVSAEANLRQQVKRSGRSQNRRIQKGLPA